MNHYPYPNRDDANRAARENEIEQDRREHVARCADTPNAGCLTAPSTTPDGLIMAVKGMCEDWAHDHTYLQKLCLEAGFSDHEVEGDKYGIRSITQLADLLHSKAAVLGMEKASLAAEMHNLERKNARLEGLLIKLVEAGEKLKKELVIECHKIGYCPREIDEWDAAATAKEAQP